MQRHRRARPSQAPRLGLHHTHNQQQSTAWVSAPLPAACHRLCRRRGEVQRTWSVWCWKAPHAGPSPASAPGCPARPCTTPQCWAARTHTRKARAAPGSGTAAQRPLRVRAAGCTVSASQRGGTKKCRQPHGMRCNDSWVPPPARPPCWPLSLCVAVGPLTDMPAHASAVAKQVHDGRGGRDAQHRQVVAQQVVGDDGGQQVRHGLPERHSRNGSTGQRAAVSDVQGLQQARGLCDVRPVYCAWSPSLLITRDPPQLTVPSAPLP